MADIDVTPILVATLPTLLILGSALLLLYRTPKTLQNLLEAMGRRGGKAAAGPIGVEIAATPRQDVFPAGQEPPPAPSEEPTQVEEETAEEERPLLIQALDARLDGDQRRSDELLDIYIAAAENEDEHLLRSAVKLRFQFEAGNATALSKLAALSDENPESAHPLRQLAFCYAFSKEHDSAAKFLEESARLLPPGKERIEWGARAAGELRKAGKAHAAKDALMELLGQAAPGEEKALVYRELGDLENERGDQHLAAELYELSTEENPGDSDTRFKLAYLYSQIVRDELSLFHYDVLSSMPNATDVVLNNLAIAYGNLEMPAKAIVLLKRAAERGLTLSMSNLAEQLSRQGFKDEAQEWLERARGQEERHPRVDEIYSRIAQQPQDEQQKEKAALEKAHEEREVWLRIAAGRYGEPIDPSSIPGPWKSNVGSITFKPTPTGIVGNTDEDIERVFDGSLEGHVLNFAWRTSIDSGSGALAFDENVSEFAGVLRSSKYPVTGWKLIRGSRQA